MLLKAKQYTIESYCWLADCAVLSNFPGD